MVVGPFANLSDDFTVLCDFLGRARALRAISSWNIDPKHALVINRHILVTRFGYLAALVWARLILGRFLDALCCPIPLKIFLAQTLSLMPFPPTPIGGFIMVVVKGLKLFELSVCLLPYLVTRLFLEKK